MRPLRFLVDCSTYVGDIIFPPSPTLRTTRKTTTHDVEKLFHRTLHNTIISLSDYRNPTIRALITEAKFHYNHHAYALLSTLLCRELTKHDRTSIIIPIPLSKVRHRTRGYNQVEEIAHYAKKESWNVRTDILLRTHDTVPQTSLNKLDRINNLKGAFTCIHPEVIKGAPVIIFDDVTTTGTTLLEARNVILQHRPASVICVALAH